MVDAAERVTDDGLKIINLAHTIRITGDSEARSAFVVFSAKEVGVFRLAAFMCEPIEGPATRFKITIVMDEFEQARWVKYVKDAELGDIAWLQATKELTCGRSLRFPNAAHIELGLGPSHWDCNGGFCFGARVIKWCEPGETA